ncbi:MAG: cytochrome c family protein [Acidobacteriota bacterium]
MKRMVALLAVSVGVVLVLSSPRPSRAAERAYIGAQKCKMCHNSAAKGAQFKKWTESRHSRAYATLASERARKIAAGRGIADPQKADECLRCHVAGHGAPAEMLTQKYSPEDGVSCEACHGPGGDYWKMSVMKDPTKAVAAGLVIPEEKTCTACHNSDSPTFESFDFATYSKKIAHPNPKKAAK